MSTDIDKTLESLLTKIAREITGADESLVFCKCVVELTRAANIMASTEVIKSYGSIDTDNILNQFDMGGQASN